MGGTLALDAARRRGDVVGVVAINAIGVVADPDVIEHLEYMIGRGKTMQPAGAPDIRNPDARDSAYIEQPRQALLEMTIGAGAVSARLGEVSVPVLVVSGDHDATIEPANSDAIAAA
ncbi:MAG TPA: hypothetical protein PLV68_05070, partial [Ilumatobacteraceae bacterium]|nr:hypothetical protein [Ilumatobacteraceae bacterium]